MVDKIIKKCQLFTGIAENQLETLLDCLTAVRQAYEKDEFIFIAGNMAVSVGIVISGSARVIQEDFWGNRVILSHIEPGGVFGESFSCAAGNKLPVSVIAAEKSEILLINCRKIITSCTSACIFHKHLTMNMLQILADKNIQLTWKIEHITKPTIREKLISFLSANAVQVKSNTVEIPFNRQELADYLCVDRSALSRELSLMQKDGLLRYNKNHFELLCNGRD